MLFQLYEFLDSKISLELADNLYNHGIIVLHDPSTNRVRLEFEEE